MTRQATIMGMPVDVHIVDTNAIERDIDDIFLYLRHVDAIFSPYKKDSEISKINDGRLEKENASGEVQHIFALCEETKQETHGYFDMTRNGRIDPSGIVKGYAIHEAANMLRDKRYKSFSVTIAGDTEVVGSSKGGRKGWRIGIQNPFNTKEIIKVIQVTDKGVATSGNYTQGQHIYNPHTGEMADKIASMTVIAKNAYEADRFATAAFAMGENGIQFIEGLPRVEGYMVTKEKKAIMTSGFGKFL